MNRRLTGVFAVLALVASACSSTATSAPAATPSAPAATPSGAATSEATSAPNRRMAFFVPWTQDVWYVVAIDGAKAEAAKLGVTLDVYDANNKPETQILQFDTALASKPEAMVLSAVDPAGMVPSIKKAVDEGVKVVVYDRPIYATDKLGGLLVLDTKNMGEIACQQIVATLSSKYGSAKGTVIRAYGDLADTWVTGISSGWDPCMAKYPDVHILKASSGKWDPTQSAANVSQLLASHPDVDAITLDSDFLSPGILTDLKTGGYGKVDESNHIYLLGNGGMREALVAIGDGWMDATVYNPVPDFTAAAVKFADMLANGQQIPSQWVEPGKAWSPATVTLNTPTADEPYAGPVLNMKNFIVDKSNYNDPTLWGNIAG